MAGMAPLLRAHRDQIKATLAWNIEKGIALTGEQIAAARAGHAAIFERVRSFLSDGRYDVLALPTVQVVPFDVDTEWVREINGEPMATYIDWMRSCSRITVSAHPAVSVPAGLTEPARPRPPDRARARTEPRPDRAPPDRAPPRPRPACRSASSSSAATAPTAASSKSPPRSPSCSAPQTPGPSRNATLPSTTPPAQLALPNNVDVAP